MGSPSREWDVFSIKFMKRCYYFDIAYAHVESKAEESANKSTTVIDSFTMVVSFLSFKAAADSYFHTQPVVSLYK